MKIINIVSGKGGTGKTLLTAVLAEILGNEGFSVLVIDLDVFVRGLTSLLYYHKKEKIQLCEPNEITVSEFFMKKGRVISPSRNKLAISRYRSFDVMPSVSRVDEILRFSDLMPDSKEEAKLLIRQLISMIPEKYDFIFLDSRAGYDELISASHSFSDITICVEEEDNISKITTDNLINQMQVDFNGPIFRLINKSSPIDNSYAFSSVTHIGRIPFDMDIMRSFGTVNFWDDINKTLYKESVISSWNILSDKMDLSKKITESRKSPLGSPSIERKLQFFPTKDRVIIFYGVTLGFMGVLYPIFKLSYLHNLINDPELVINLASSLIGVIGFAMTFYIIFKNRKK